MNYIFFIGGSGARVYKAFLHACASGIVRVDAANVILLDADSKNAACLESCKLFHLYEDNHKAFYKSDKSFPAFHCDIKMYHDDAVSPIHTSISNLREITGGNNTRKRILNWFYTEEEQGQDLEKGFYAHPNIGCIFFQNVGHNVHLNNCLQDIVTDLKNDKPVRVVIVGSVFGGTGAAGIPSILKILEKKCKDEKLPFDALHSCGVLIMPYFKVIEPDEVGGIKIDSDTFYGNTKNALNYYQYTDKFEKYYLVGQTDLDLVNAKYADGGKAQDNKAHIVEVYAMMAIKCFLEGKSGDTKVSGRIINSSAARDRISWNSFDEDIYALADMIRTQTILETAIYPYIQEKVNGQQEGKWGLYQWYKVYNISANDPALLNMKKYGAMFFEWMYCLQYEYALPPKPPYPSTEVTLCRPDILEQLWTRVKSRSEYGAAVDPDSNKYDWKQYQENFFNLVDRAEKIEYVAEKVIMILSALGVVSKSISKLSFIGLFMKLLSLSKHKQFGDTN